jgi:integrase/recombinase XerD
MKRWTDYMQAHFEWMAVTGYSEDTVRARRTALRRFIAWCEERALRDPKDITKPILERYQRHLFYYRKVNGRPMTLGSQFGCLAPLKTFFKWLAKENHILYNPASEIALPKLPKHLPRIILSIQEIEAILREAEPSTASGLRDRVVPIGERAAAWVEKYLQEARPQLLIGDTESLFLTDYGEPMSPEYVAERVRRYMHFAGVNKPGACHLFRHACATHMLENGADTRFIQALLGHADLGSTQIYTRVSIDKLREIHDATHPAKLHRTATKRRRESSSAESVLAALEAEDEPDDGAGIST